MLNNSVKETERCITESKKLQKDFENIKNSINGSFQYKDEKMNAASFFKFMYNLLEVIKNHFSALSYVYSQLITAFNCMIKANAVFARKMLNNYGDMYSDEQKQKFKDLILDEE